MSAQPAGPRGERGGFSQRSGRRVVQFDDLIALGAHVRVWRKATAHGFGADRQGAGSRATQRAASGRRVAAHAALIASVAAIELVLDLADELFDDVFEGQQPGDLPVLVEHEREVSLVTAHVAQHRIDPGLFGDAR